jgi:hypothetical protein
LAPKIYYWIFSTVEVGKIIIKNYDKKRRQL